MPKQTAIAIAAHPDDIEFCMAGTLLKLRLAGWEIHYLNIANGCCGSVKYDRGRGARHSQSGGSCSREDSGAHFHPSLTNDLEIIYNPGLLRRVVAVVREVKPSIVLAHSPQDYMEDHTNACRLAVSAAFARGMPNFNSIPNRPAVECQTTMYHAMPHGLRDPLRRRIVPGAYINTTAVHPTKMEALAAHKSQQDWLDASQGMNSYLRAMEEFSLEVGRMSKRFRLAEGWRRHLHLGLCAADADPLREALGGDFIVNKEYERRLEKG